MKEIEIKLHRKWENTPQEKVVRRFTDIIFGSHKNFHWQDTGYDWTMGEGNDWKCERNKEDKTKWIIAYRYGFGFPEKMKHLEKAINWLMR